ERPEGNRQGFRRGLCLLTVHVRRAPRRAHADHFLESARGRRARLHVDGHSRSRADEDHSAAAEEDALRLHIPSGRTLSLHLHAAPSRDVGTGYCPAVIWSAAAMPPLLSTSAVAWPPQSRCRL